MARFLRVVFYIILLTCLSLSCAAQFPGPGQEPQPQNRPSEQEIKIQREQAKKLNKQRYENLKKDTDKLLELATQLKKEVDKSSESTLSVDVIKKCEEIEKLSRSVKQKMKGY